MRFRGRFFTGESLEDRSSGDCDMPTIADALERKRLRDEYEGPGTDFDEFAESEDEPSLAELRVLPHDDTAADLDPTIFDRMLDADPRKVAIVTSLAGAALGGAVVISQIIHKL